MRLHAAALAATTLTARVAAHSWVDCIDHSYDVVYTNSDRWVLTGHGGNGVCEGYAYKYPGRGVNTIGTDFTHKLLPEDIASDKPVCQYRAKDADYTGWRKAIVAKPGDKLYFAYFSNGHVVKDKAGPGTTHGVYWDGRPGVELERPSQLTPERLVDKLQDFDDGNCGETYVNGNFAGGTELSGRAGDFKPCVGSFTIPSATKPGTYPMVWWWTFFKPGDLADHFQHFEGAGGAAYSSCFDVIVEVGSAASTASNLESDAVQGEADVVPPLPVFKITSVSTNDAVKCDVAADSEPTTAPVRTSTNPQPPIMGTVHAETEAPPTPAPQTTVTPTLAPQTTVTPTLAPQPSVTPTLATAPTTTTATAPPASATPSVTPFVPANIFAAPLSAITITGVGGKGTYGKVSDMPCPSGATGASDSYCVQTPVDVSGSLAPFDEDLTLALRGPLEIDDIAVFTRGDEQQSPWTKSSSYSRAQRNATQNMVFLNNKGDPAKSGEFSFCHGNSQSFATADGSAAASSSTAFEGKLADGVEVNVMSATTCAESGKSGFARGVGYEGWSGNHKIFMVKARMPHAAGGKDLPAIWLLNGQVVRTAQYGCNCRGVGDTGAWKGGCGELDVAEIIPENKDMLVSMIYSFKGSRGTSPVTPRPTDASVVFVVILSATSPSASALGTAQILVMRPEHVDMANPPSAQRVDEWLAYRNGKLVDFDI